MSGGAEEYVMGVYWDEEKLWSGNSDGNSHSGFNGWLYYDDTNYLSGVPYPSDDKYYNLYTNTGTDSSPKTDYNSNKQHALIETSGWYGDDAYFVTDTHSWFVRGGKKEYTYGAGIFSFRGFFFDYRIQATGSRSSIIID